MVYQAVLTAIPSMEVRPGQDGERPDRTLRSRPDPCLLICGVRDGARPGGVPAGSMLIEFSIDPGFTGIRLGQATRRRLPSPHHELARDRSHFLRTDGSVRTALVAGCWSGVIWRVRPDKSLCGLIAV